MEIIPLDWDSAFFQLRIAKAIVKSKYYPSRLANWVSSTT
jgi:hypothetical protein